MKIYDVAIIGCGSIGAMKSDSIDYPGSSNILTHANAVDRHPRTKLSILNDINDKQLQKAFNKWQPSMASKYFQDILNMHPDIIIITTPTGIHYDILIDLIINQNLPKLIIAEKPFCSNLREANEIIEKSKECCTDGRRKIPIMIDYIRRYAQGYKDIKKQIDSRTFGKALNCRVLYTRGMHDCCHAVDLMRYFFGEYIFIDYVESKNFIIDRDKNDPTIYFKMSFENCPHVTFSPCDGRKYGIFEIDICFEKCRLRFIDNGLYVEKYPINQENEWGHKSLDYKLTSVVRQETGLNIALYGLIDNAVKFLDGEEDLICTDKDAIAVHEILEGLK